MAVTKVEVIFTPTTFTTAEAEIAFRTTEFDSQPVICRIVGNALPHKNAPVPQDTEFSVKKTKARTLLTSKPERRPSSRAGVKLDKLPEKALAQTSLPHASAQSQPHSATTAELRKKPPSDAE